MEKKYIIIISEFVTSFRLRHIHMFGVIVKFKYDHKFAVWARKAYFISLEFFIKFY